jgi:hypothetical protein
MLRVALAAGGEPLPIGLTAGVVLFACVLAAVAWLVSLYR